MVKVESGRIRKTSDCSGQPEAEINTWTGNGDGMLWSDWANWCDGIVPLDCQHVVILSGHNVLVAPGVQAVGRTLKVKINSELTVEGTGTVEIKAN